MNKGQVSNVPYVIFIITFSLILVVGFTFTPLQVIDRPLEISPIKNLIKKNLIDHQISYQDPFILRNYDSIIVDENSFNPKVSDYIIPGKETTAIRLVYGNKNDTYGDFELFNAETRKETSDYYLFKYSKSLFCEDGSCGGSLIFEEVIPKSSNSENVK